VGTIGRIRIVSLVVGVALILPPAYLAEQELFVLRRSDIKKALEPLAVIPLTSMRPGAPISREVTAPSGRWWNRMTSTYGNPKFLIAAVNVPIGAGGHDRRVYRTDEVPINVKVLRAGSPVKLQSTTDAPYIYSSEPTSGGQLFAASAGEHLNLTAELMSPGQPLPGDLVVVANWPRSAISDAFDAFSIVDTFRWFLLTSCAIGVVLIVYGVRGSRRQRSAS
jgi:hypothetical protein